jgi:hypothetical protein
MPTAPTQTTLSSSTSPKERAAALADVAKSGRIEVETDSL